MSPLARCQKCMSAGRSNDVHRTCACPYPDPPRPQPARAPLQEKWKGLARDLRDACSKGMAGAQGISYTLCSNRRHDAADALDKAAELAARVQDVLDTHAVWREPSRWSIKYAVEEKGRQVAAMNAAMDRLAAALTTTSTDAPPDLSDRAANALADFVVADAELRGDEGASHG